MFQGYGLTEVTLAVILFPVKSIKKVGSSGKVVPGMMIRIRNPETGESLGPNQIGEICIKGDMVMKGYHENYLATKETFDSYGWLLTGDIGYYDDDECFYIVDRLKELIKYKGYQVAPAELEGILLTHPDIKDAGVLGIPDDLAGELPMAVIVKQTGSNLKEDDVIKFIAG